MQNLFGRAPSPVRVEGEAQGVAAPQHQLAYLVDVDVDDDVDLLDVDIDIDVDVDLADLASNLNQPPRLLALSLRPCPKLIIIPYLL